MSYNSFNNPKKAKAIDLVVNKISSLRRSLDLSNIYIKEMDTELKNLQNKFNKGKV